MTHHRPANAEMQQGFRDGYDLNCPEPSGNRSHSYRHGFKAGRNDRMPHGKGPFGLLPASAVQQLADDAMRQDEIESKLMAEAWRKA